MVENKIIEDIEEQIRQFASKQLSVKPERLTASTRLMEDLGVDGDDGVEFMQAFARRFGVDLSDWKTDLYFGPEAGCDPLTFLHYLFSPGTRPKFVPITFADLLQSAQEGKWRTPSRDAA